MDSKVIFRNIYIHTKLYTQELTIEEKWDHKFKDQQVGVYVVGFGERKRKRNLNKTQHSTMFLKQNQDDSDTIIKKHTTT